MHECRRTGKGINIAKSERIQQLMAGRDILLRSYAPWNTGTFRHYNAGRVPELLRWKLRDFLKRTCLYLHLLL